jgi:hypothetical protein
VNTAPYDWRAEGVFDAALPRRGEAVLFIPLLDAISRSGPRDARTLAAIAVDYYHQRYADKAGTYMGDPYAALDRLLAAGLIRWSNAGWDGPGYRLALADSAPRGQQYPDPEV